MATKLVQYIGKDARIEGATVEGETYEFDGKSKTLSLPEHAAHVLVTGEPEAWAYKETERAAPAPAKSAEKA